MICSVKGCGRPKSCRGLCATHYARFRRTGDVDAGRPIGVGKGVKLLFEIASVKTDDCINWPLSTGENCYGQVTENYKNFHAHRKICEIVHGPPASSELQAAHSCGNRRCVNPRHLRWATPRENTHDKFRHGTMRYGEKNGTAKISDEQAIKAFFDARPAKDIASELGVCKDAIIKLKRGVTFRRVIGFDKYETALEG